MIDADHVTSNKAPLVLRAIRLSFRDNGIILGDPEIKESTGDSVNGHRRHEFSWEGSILGL